MRRLVGYGLFFLLLTGCQNQSPPQTPQPDSTSSVSPAPSGPPREFKLEGDIVRVDKEKKTATVKHGPIEGYMSAMTMSYPIPDSADLDKIKEGDHITATVYDDQAQYKFWLGNIKVGEPAAK